MMAREREREETILIADSPAWSKDHSNDRKKKVPTKTFAAKEVRSGEWSAKT
jgi:hypothetical protein